jgi:Mg/Co/Ni transporter MgtE
LLITGALSAAAFGFIEDLHAGVFVLALVATLVASTLGAVIEQMTASDRRLPFTGK